MSPTRDDPTDSMKICLRCGRKAGFAPDELSDGYVSDCCGWEAVDPSDAVDATDADSTGTP